MDLKYVTITVFSSINLKFIIIFYSTRSLVTSGDRENDEDRVGEEVTRSVLYG